MRGYYSVIVLVGLLFLGCSQSTVVLADNGERKNGIVFTTKAGSVAIDKVGGYVDVSSSEELPKEVKTMSSEEMLKRFDEIEKVGVKKPVTFLLYFQTGSSILTDESKALLPRVKETVRSRQPCLIDIIGHTDTVGDNQLNIQVSKKRAQEIANLLKKEGINEASMTVKGYGEEDLLVSTADNVDEPKNRNVEILIK